MRNLRGFTLIELLVVIAIIAILAAFLLPSLLGAKCASKAGVAKSTIRDLESALNSYLESFGVYPGAVGFGPRADGGGGSSAILVRFLRDEMVNIGRTPFYHFREGSIEGGRYYNPIAIEPDYEYFYRENRSMRYSQRNPAPRDVGNPSTFDLFTAGCSRPPNREEINNWQ